MLNPSLVWRFLGKVRVNPLSLLIPAVLGFAAAFFEGISLGLLIPTIKGIIEGNPGFVRETPILKTFVFFLPQEFERRNSPIFVLLIGLIFLAAVAKNVLQYLSALGVSYQVNRFANQLRKLIYERYLSYGKLFFDNHNAGHLHQILTGHTTMIAQQFQVLNSSLYSFFTLIAYLVIMFSISRPLTLLVIVLSPALQGSVNWLIRKIRKTSEVYAASSSGLARSISNVLTCIPLMKAYSHEAEEGKWFAQASDQVEKFQFSMDKKNMLISPIHEIILLSMVLLFVGLIAFFFVYEKSGEIAGYMVFFVILRRSMTTLGVFSQVRSSVAVVQGPAMEIMKIFEEGEKYSVSDGHKEFPGLKREIHFHHLSFSYPRGVEALRDVTFAIEKGKTTAIVGPSGAGKTTLINLVMRFYDNPPGTALIDGEDIRNFTLKSLRSKMALVSQETLLFNATFRENLVYGLDGKVTEEALEAAVRSARLHDLVAKLLQGYDTEIGDRGVKLSGGEKQRLSIARAILKKAEILILDEATSALDTRTEMLIQEAIDDAIRGRTAIVIAHRFSTIKHADKIVVLEEGRFVESGSLDELLEKKGRFFQYWEAQKFY